MYKKLTPLEALGIIAYGKQMENTDVCVVRETQNEAFRIVGDALKALEIIKEKKVNVRAFLKCCRSEDGLTIYNNQCDDKQEKESKELTKEEYDLLKEILQ